MLARDDAIEWRADFRVAEQRFSFHYGGLSHQGFGPRVVVFGWRENFLCQQRRRTLQIGFGLLPDGEGLIEPRLHLARVNVCEQFAGLHLLSGDDEHLIHLAAHLGLNDGTQLGAHGSDHFFRGHAFLAFDNLRTNRHRWQRGQRGWFPSVSATGERQRHSGGEKDRSFHEFASWPELTGRPRLRLLAASLHSNRPPLYPRRVFSKSSRAGKNL